MRDTFLGGSKNKGYSILELKMGTPFSRKLPCKLWSVGSGV